MMILVMFTSIHCSTIFFGDDCQFLLKFHKERIVPDDYYLFMGLIVVGRLLLW